MSGAPTKVTISMALIPPKMTFIGFYVAKDEGFFKKEGLDMDFVPENNGVPATRALVAGSVDMSATSADDVIAAAAAGGKVHAIWGYAMPLDTTIIADQSVKTAADLKGKNLGITDPGGFADTQMRAVLAQANVPASETHIISMASRSAFVPGLITGNLNAASFHVDDGLVVMRKDPKLHTIASMYKVLPYWWYGAVATSDSWNQSHAGVIERFITAMDEADRWIYSHRAQTIAIGVKETQEPEYAVAGAYDFLAKAEEWTTNTGLEENRINETMAYEHKIGIVNRQPTYSQAAIPTYANAVVAKIGTWKTGY
ncbi:MAG: ABC transporter substrate-binding protein [Solirubrobacteraceae bacterium]